MTATNWLELLLDFLLPILGALAVWLGVAIRNLILAHVRNTELQAVLLRFNDAISTAVGEVEQVVVVGLKDAAQDGKITPDEAMRIRDLAKTKALSYLGVEGVKRAREVLGLDDDALERILVAKIEAAVAAQRAKVVKP